MGGGFAGGLVRRGWRNVREAGPRRLALTGLLVLLALLIARYGWGLTPNSELPVISPAERAMYDFRSYLNASRHAVDQDQRVVMVVYIDDAFFRRVRAGRMSTREDIVAAHAEGTVQRLRPKVMTIVTMAAALGWNAERAAGVAQEAAHTLGAHDARK